MSYQGSMLSIQKNILNYATPGVPYEIISALLAARQFNSRITEADTENGPGKLRTLKINFRPPICDDDGSCSDSVCETGRAVPPQQAFFDLLECTASEVYELPLNSLRYIDGAWSFSDDALSIIRAALPSVHKKLATAMVGKLIANVGLQPDGNETRMLPWVNKNTGEVNPIGLWEVERAFRDTGYNNPFIIGGGDIYYWKKAVEIGGLNNLGQNIAQLGRTNAYYEPLVNVGFADPTQEHIIAFDPMLLKFMTFSENAGQWATDLSRIEDINTMYERGGTDYIKGVFADPTYGMLWDFYAKVDDCNNVIRFQIKLKWDIWFMPNTVCTIQGVNSRFHFTTCAPVAVECPTGSPITPADEATFSASASGISFPYYVANMKIAGQTTQPNQSVANLAALVALMNQEIAGYTFTVNGTDIEYEGYAAITGGFNNGEETLTWS